MEDFMTKKQSLRPLYMIILSTILFSSYLVPSVLAQENTTNSTAALQLQFCSLIGIISSLVGIIAIFLFVLGGILYGVGLMLPGAGNLKGSTQGWGIGMLIGGVIAVVLYLLSSFIVYRIASFGTNSPIPAITQVNCNNIKNTGDTGGTATTTSSGGSTLAPAVETSSNLILMVRSKL